jgi:hypothetical protein
MSDDLGAARRAHLKKVYMTIALAGSGGLALSALPLAVGMGADYTNELCSELITSGLVRVTSIYGISREGITKQFVVVVVDL